MKERLINLGINALIVMLSALLSFLLSQLDQLHRAGDAAAFGGVVSGIGLWVKHSFRFV
jgi:hypothetical protein